MATLVLTTIGTAIGGPIGGALGALLGQSVDARLFAPKGRTGPRLDELRVQTSSYGAAIPRIYGRMRVSGTVIWATDLKEHRHRQSNGKGRGSTTTYSYSVSLAVALSSRPLRGVRRIWAEGNLLRGSAGDFKSPATLRLHGGGEDQPTDPLIAAAEGVAHCPAYRGIAYAVLEDLDLTPFGNRIPSLTFEVEAVEDAPLTLAGPVAETLGGATVAPGQPDIVGAAISGGSRAAAVEPFLALLEVDRDSAGWRIGGAGDPVPLGEPMSDRGQARPERRRGGATRLPRETSLSAYDEARDFQLGVQTARVAGGDGEAERLALPVAMDAGAARALAAARALRIATGRTQASWPQGFAALAIPPGRAGRLPDGSQAIVAERRIEGAAVTLTLSDAEQAGAAIAPADPGRAILSPDELAGETRAALFDLPALLPGDEDSGRLLLAAAGSGRGWRGAGVMLRAGAGASAVRVGTVRGAMALGTVESASASTGCAMIEPDGEVIVALLHEEMALQDADDTDLIAGANLAMAGSELLQFGRAEPLGGGRWRLSRLLRGRRGTEDAAALTGPGAPFALVDDPAVMTLAPSAGLAQPAPGGSVELEGAGDDAPVILPITTFGRALRPLPPAHLALRWRDDGGADLHWVRRSRRGFEWTDGIDAPDDEAAERYALTLAAGGHEERRETTAPAYALDAAAIAQWRARGPQLVCSLSRIGARGVSATVIRSFALT